MGAWIEGDEDGYSFPFNHDAQDDAKMGPRLCLLILWTLFARSFFFRWSRSTVAFFFFLARWTELVTIDSR